MDSGNRLNLIERLPNGYGMFECKCGTIKKVRISHVKNNAIKSCGCLSKEKSRERLTTHNKSKTRLYNVWRSMCDRCMLPTSRRFSDYGGRGIRICPEWTDFSNFNDWAMSSGYDKSLTLDRIDVNGDYSPTNCRWVNMTTQNRNRRDTFYVEYEGNKVALRDLCDQLKLPHSRIYQRITKYGYSLEEALTKPPKRGSNHEMGR